MKQYSNYTDKSGNYQFSYLGNGRYSGNKAFHLIRLDKKPMENDCVYINYVSIAEYDNASDIPATFEGVIFDWQLSSNNVEYLDVFPAEIENALQSKVGDISGKQNTEYTITKRYQTGVSYRNGERKPTYTRAELTDKYGGKVRLYIRGENWAYA